MSDMIEEFIKQLFDDEDYIEIQRNDLRSILIVFRHRLIMLLLLDFKPSQGYYVESKRGGE